MIKFNAGYIPHRQATLVGFGLTDDNLHLMLREQKPVRVKSEDLGVLPPGFDLAMIAAVDEEGIKRQGLEVAEGLMSEEQKKEAETKHIAIPCIRMADTYYLFHFLGENGRVLYLIGLTEETSYKALRRDRMLPTVRIRHTPPATNVEFLIYWGTSDENMEEELFASGLVSKKNYRRM